MGGPDVSFYSGDFLETHTSKDPIRTIFLYFFLIYINLFICLFLFLSALGLRCRAHTSV